MLMYIKGGGCNAMFLCFPLGMSESYLEDKCAAARLGMRHSDGAALYWFHYVIKIVQNAHAVVMVGTRPPPR